MDLRPIGDYPISSFITSIEFAELMGLTTAQARYVIKTHQIRSIKPGKEVMVLMDDVMRYRNDLIANLKQQLRFLRRENNHFAPYDRYMEDPE